MFDRQTILADLFPLKLQGLYAAEKQLLKALPMLSDKATDPHLRMAFEKHLGETENYVVHSEQVATNLAIDLGGPHCKATRDLMEEGKQMMALNATDEILDAALIPAAQGAEHYEIAQYGAAVYFARPCPGEAFYTGNRPAPVTTGPELRIAPSPSLYSPCCN